MIRRIYKKVTEQCKQMEPTVRALFSAGKSDEPMSEYEIYSYEAFRKRICDDIRKADNLKMKLIDENRMKNYLDSVKTERKNLADNVS